ncbi:HSP20-like chaperone [Glomus cerebriforme]|uniref:HSP20-like chaperone n=1 Tax=Glomus cerebriforme TaxID=658196 RepID=A0A397S6Z4_9GLOM|nr:HSP20-like chaperone [Glomus cerebriforme]
MSLIRRNLDVLDDNFFDNFMRDLNLFRRGNIRTGWAPSLDVLETEDEFIVDAELPGLNKDDINIDIHDNILTISGETKKEQRFQDENVFFRERHFGSFNRGIALPPNLNTDDVTATFENGLLEMKFPKTELSGRKIKIQ